jgi:hypothetical protein
MIITSISKCFSSFINVVMAISHAVFELVDKKGPFDLAGHWERLDCGSGILEVFDE